MIKTYTVNYVKRLATAAARAGVSEVSEGHDLLSAVARLRPADIAELCEAWRHHRGIVRRRDVIDVKPLGKARARA